MSDERLNDLERRVAAIERELLMHRRLGPSPESHAPDPAVVDRLVEQARAAIDAAKEKQNFASLLHQKASETFVERQSIKDKQWREQQEKVVPPVDRTQRMLADGSPETPDHREINPTTGQQKGYIVLTPEERDKGFARPVRRTYVHKKCGTTTTCSLAIAETYARDPHFYGGTFCCTCRAHFPLVEFVWAGTDEQVGT